MEGLDTLQKLDLSPPFCAPLAQGAKILTREIWVWSTYASKILSGSVMHYSVQLITNFRNRSAWSTCELITGKCSLLSVTFSRRPTRRISTVHFCRVGVGGLNCYLRVFHVPATDCRWWSKRQRPWLVTHGAGSLRSTMLPCISFMTPIHLVRADRVYPRRPSDYALSPRWWRNNVPPMAISVLSGD